MPNGRKKGESYIKVLGLLDNKTRLVADKRCFIIQALHEEVWVPKYYYSDLGFAIKGYAKYLAKKQGKRVSNSAPLMEIFDLLASLEKTIKEVGNRLSKEWKEKE
jgi:hypothetical protein